MKTLAELAAVREKMKDCISLRQGMKDIRIVVGMSTCGINAGAREVLCAFVEEVAKEGLSDKVTVYQTACNGNCQNEPFVEVFIGSNEKVTYLNMSPEKAKKVIAEHIKGGKPVSEFMLKENA